MEVEAADLIRLAVPFKNNDFLPFRDLTDKLLPAKPACKLHKVPALRGNIGFFTPCAGSQVVLQCLIKAALFRGECGRMEVTFLGTGTSMGVPIIGCECDVCVSDNPRNRRTRSSIWIRLNGRNILIDTAPEMRIQALTHGIEHLDALLYTHAHADHIFGFDDIRRFNQLQRELIPVYGTKPTIDALRRIFGYAFDPKSPNWQLPQVTSHCIQGPFELFDQKVVPLTVMHGGLPVTAYRFGKFAYATDCNAIPPETMDALKNLDVLVLDALRYDPHPSHFSLAEALAVIEELQPKQAYLTHLSHSIDHTTVQTLLPDNVKPAYDGMRLRVRS